MLLDEAMIEREAGEEIKQRRKLKDKSDREAVQRGRFPKTGGRLSCLGACVPIQGGGKGEVGRDEESLRRIGGNFKTSIKSADFVLSFKGQQQKRQAPQQGGKREGKKKQLYIHIGGIKSGKGRKTNGGGNQWKLKRKLSCPQIVGSRLGCHPKGKAGTRGKLRWPQKGLRKIKQKEKGIVTKEKETAAKGGSRRRGRWPRFPEEYRSEVGGAVGMGGGGGEDSERRTYTRSKKKTTHTFRKLTEFRKESGGGSPSCQKGQAL